MTFSALHALVAYMLSGLGLAALTLGGELSPPAAAVLLGGWAASAALGRTALAQSPGWARGWTTAVVVVFAVEVARAGLGAPVLPCGLEYAGFLQVSRLMVRRTARDYQYVAILAFMHLVFATVLSTELGYALVFAGFVIVTPWALALTHLRREIEGNYPVPGARDDRGSADVRRVLASRRVVSGRFLAGTAALAVPIFLLTAAVFFLFPRVGLGFLTFGHGRARRVAGFGDHVDLSGFGAIRDDPTVVLRVSPPADAPRPRPARVALRMRGTAFDLYDGTGWSRTAGAVESLGHVEAIYPLQRFPDGRHDAQLRIVLEPLEQPVVFLPEHTVALQIAARGAAALPRSRELVRGAGYDVRYVDRDDLGLAYVAWVSRDPAEPSLEPLLPSETGRYLTVPPGHERVRALARRVVGDESDPYGRARRIERWLTHDSGLRYSLDTPRPGPNEPPLVGFLFRSRRGHCELFSTAMAIMLRSVGIPTRNVAGYFGGRYNAYGDYYAIRQGDAHSWVEAWIPDRGWTTFDPTPPASREAAAHDGALEGLDAMLDAIRNAWSTRVVSYDLDQQLSLARRLFDVLGGTSGVPRTTHRGLPRPGEPTESSAESGRGLPTSWVLAGLAACFLLAGLVLLVRRGRRRTDAGTHALAPAAREARSLQEALDRALEAAGVARPPHATPTEHARALAARRFVAAEAVEAVTARTVAARFGGEALGRDEASALRGRLAEVRRARAPS